MSSSNKNFSKCIVAFHSYNIGVYQDDIEKNEELHLKKIEKEFLKETFPKFADNLLNNASWADSSSEGSFFKCQNLIVFFK